MPVGFLGLLMCVIGKKKDELIFLIMDTRLLLFCIVVYNLKTKLLLGKYSQSVYHIMTSRY